MASGQGPGPPSQECKEPDLSSASEEQVAQDTEEVFRSYVFYRHQQEQAEGAGAPADPEMVTLPPEPSSTMGQVGRQLALIGDDINRRYDSEFQIMLDQLQPTAENAYEYFTKIAKRPAAPHSGNLPAASLLLCPPPCSCPVVPTAWHGSLIHPLSFLLSQDVGSSQIEARLGPLCRLDS
ncbi:PREDICTED: bcl-2 homologous antagonist/killer isoform X2 [Condylura cristata]|uniref:bcl-2 homologous antagonist/killer isoform X2 n=1 Tax=Condylura cristata TaxID=143302 RepID=UPI0006432798|nr:PREDICTED: bcl-2 homologous antagonist/killer isoform X2 [Condylura cristata]